MPKAQYVYIKDTIGVRVKLIELYKKKYPSYKYRLAIKSDKMWESYLKFLYPSEETMESIANEKILSQLRNAGDNLKKPRQVDHWLYFSSGKDRDIFVKYVDGKKFRIEEKKYQKNLALPYGLHVSREDNIEPASINALTIELKRKAKELNGIYDGWETVIVKD